MQAILRARMASARLPGKVLLPAAGKPMILHNADRIARARLVERVVIATGDTPENDELERVCRAAGLEVFRGSEDDVLARIVGCARQFGMTTFCKFTADNPLIDPEVIDLVLTFFEEGGYDYASNNHPPTWQDGQEVEVMTLKALEEAFVEAREPFQREHVTPFLWDQPERYRVGNVARPDDSWHKRFRWTLDYPEDYTLIREVYEALGPEFTTAQVMELLERRPDLHAVNARHAGYTWYAEHQDELKTL